MSKAVPIQFNARISEHLKRKVKKDAAATDYNIDDVAEVIIKTFFKTFSAAKRKALYREHVGT